MWQHRAIASRHRCFWHYFTWMDSTYKSKLFHAFEKDPLVDFDIDLIDNEECVREKQFSSKIYHGWKFDKEHGGENQFWTNIDFFEINVYCLKISNNLNDLVSLIKFEDCDIICFQILWSRCCPGSEPLKCFE